MLCGTILGCRIPSAVASLFVKDEIAQPAHPEESVPGVPIRGALDGDEILLSSPVELEGRVVGTIGMLSGRVAACLRIRTRYISKVLFD